MNITHLRRRGWTEQEITHLAARLKWIETHRHALFKILEHASLWFVTTVLLLGAVGLVVEMLPAILLSRVSGAVLFLVGICFGVLFVQATYHLGLERRHHHASAGVLIIGSIVVNALVLQTVSARIDVPATGTLEASILFGLGIIVPYMLHGRLHAPA